MSWRALPAGADMNALYFTLLVLLSVPIAAPAQGPGVFALRTRLQDKNPEIRMKAAEGLGRGGGRQGTIILRQGLADKSPTVRIAVVEALGFIGGRLSMTVLSEALVNLRSCSRKMLCGLALGRVSRAAPRSRRGSKHISVRTGCSVSTWSVAR